MHLLFIIWNVPSYSNTKTRIDKSFFHIDSDWKNWKQPTSNCDIFLFCFVFPPLDLLRSLLLQRPLCKWTEHLSQSARPHTGVPGHERQQWMVARGGRRTARLRTFKLHPQIWIYMNDFYQGDGRYMAGLFLPDRAHTVRADRTKHKASSYTPDGLFLICCHGVW